jgi:sugar/nucleoside kinase (ribokinase family)
MNHTNKTEVSGIGSPMLDHLLYISEEYLEKIPGEKWGMEVVNFDTILKIIEESNAVPEQVAGGSCSNTIKGLASLGHSCRVTGKIGQDSIGERVKEHMQNLNIDTAYLYSSTPTAHVACLITPDGKRTLRCYMGACSEMTPEDLDPKLFEGIKVVHFEGYSLLCPGLTIRGMELAKKAGAAISFDMGSFEMVKNFRDIILGLLGEYVDIVFVNQDEIQALVNNGPEEGCRILSELCGIAVVMLGEDGSLVGYDKKIEKCPAFPVKPTDTTGAGDLFASGFLHGYLLGLPPNLCALYGAITGSAVVQVVGAEIPPETWPKIKSLMKEMGGMDRIDHKR